MDGIMEMKRNGLPLEQVVYRVAMNNPYGLTVTYPQINRALEILEVSPLASYGKLSEEIRAGKRCKKKTDKRLASDFLYAVLTDCDVDVVECPEGGGKVIYGGV